VLSTTEPRFPENLRDRASQGPPLRAAVAGAHRSHVLEGVRLGCHEGWIDPILIGPEAKIREAADSIGWDVSSTEVRDHVGEEAIAADAASVASSCGMVIKGHLHTSRLLSALLHKDAGVRGEAALAHVFYVTPTDGGRALAISDGALNIAPDLEMRRRIIGLLVEMFHALGVTRPRIALLAATEEVASHMPVTEDARALTEWAALEDLQADVFGPLAMDVALAPKAAAIKGIKSPVAGAADALLVPTIEVGNAVTKALVWCSGACAAGIVLGGRIPVLIPSRSDASAARLAAIALSRIVVRAQG